MIHYCNSMPYNAISKCIEILAMDHGYGSLRYARYDETTNNFLLITNDVGLGSQTQHGYDHVEVNPFSGDLYYRQYSLNSGTIKCFRKPRSSASNFIALPGLAATNGAEQVAIGTCWWSGSFNGGGSQGSYMVFNSGNSTGTPNDGQISAFDPVTNSWFFNKAAMAPNFGTSATYHSIMEYSAVKNVAVYGGGNGAPTSLWRLSSNGSFVTMPDVPAGKAVGMQRGLITADPVTGNFLLLSAGELWELNPSGAGSWARQGGSRVPPGAVGIPGPNQTDAVICSAIPPYGVIAYIKQPSSSGATFFLYKHA